MEKYIILVLLAEDIKGIYVEYIQVYLQVCQQEKGLHSCSGWGSCIPKVSPEQRNKNVQSAIHICPFMLEWHGLGRDPLPNMVVWGGWT